MVSFERLLNPRFSNERKVHDVTYIKINYKQCTSLNKQPDLFSQGTL